MVKLSREDAFRLLDVEPDASEEEIKKAYKKLALKSHPDKNPNDPDGASAKFKEVYAAYQKLTQPEEEEDEYEMDEDMSDAFTFFMYMMQRQMGGMRGGGYGAPRSFPGGGGFGFTFMGGSPFGSTGGGPSVFSGSSRSTNFFTDDGFELYEDDDDDDYYHSQYNRAEQHRAEQQWQRDRRAERLARRREKEAAANAEMNRKRAERAEQERVAREERRQRQQAQAAKIPKATPEEIAAQHEEEVRKQLPKLPRPTMADRTESSISLNLARKRESQASGMWEVSYHALHDPNWIVKQGKNSESPVVCERLQPGTKYVFKARAGQHPTPSKIVWGEWSVESQYVTVGQAAAPANAPAAAQPAAAASKKSRKKSAEKKGEKKSTGVSAQQAAFDEQAAIEQLKAEQEKEAARAAAVERAAAEYAAETAKLQAPKAAAAQEAEAKKAKKKRNKHKKAPLQPENSEPASEQKENRSHQPNAYPTQAQRQAPTTTPPPPPYSAGARDFGLGLPGQGPAQRMPNQAAAARPQTQHRPNQAAASGAEGSWAQSELGLSAADRERLNIQEAIQISQALEESMRMYEEENRRAPPDATLTLDEDKFPSLPGGSPATPPRPPLAAPKPQQHRDTSSSSAAAKPQQPSTRAGPSGTASGQGRNLNQVSWDGSNQRPANHLKQDNWAVGKQNGWDTDPDDQATEPIAETSQTNWQNPAESQGNWPNPAQDQTNWLNPAPTKLQDPVQEQQRWNGNAQKEDGQWGQPEKGTQQESTWQQSQQQPQDSWREPQHQPQGSWEQPRYQPQGSWEQPQHQGVHEQPQQQADYSQDFQHQGILQQSHGRFNHPKLQQEGSWDQSYQKDWDQPQQQAIWRQPQNDWTHTKQRDSTDQPQQGSWEQPQYQSSWQQPQQQGSWQQPTQNQSHNFWDVPNAASEHQPEQHQSLNQGGWDAPNQDSGYREGKWGEEGYEQRPGIPGLSWQGHNASEPVAPGQTQWEPTPDSYRSGLTIASLAHHDKLTGADIRKAERQKASIDKWNQEGTDSSVANQQPGHLYNRQSPLMNHHKDHPGAGYDDASQIQDDQYQGRQSLQDLHAYNAPPARRYDPYDLSPANLGSYPANSADLTGFGHHAADNGDSSQRIAQSGYLERLNKAPEYTDGSHDQSYSRDHHDPHTLNADAYGAMYNSSYEPYRPPAQYRAHHGSPHEQHSSQNRQQPQQNRVSSIGQGNNPAQGYTEQPQDYSQQRQGFPRQPQSQPLAASGWDDDLPDQKVIGHPAENGHAAEARADESSKWMAPIDSDQRQRDGQGRGRGKGGGRGRKRGGQQWKSDRPASAHQQQQDSYEAPGMQSTHLMSEADALKLMHQGHSHPHAHQTSYQHGNTSHGSRAQFPSHRSASNAGSRAGAGLFVPDLFPREVS